MLRFTSDANPLVPAAILACFMAAPGLAQDRALESPRPGQWALSFAVGSNFTLHNWENFLVAFERHSSASSALRLGITPHIHTDVDDRTYIEATTVSRLSRAKAEQTNLGTLFQLQYVAYSDNPGKLRIFWAAGPRLSFFRGHGEVEGVDIAGDGTFARHASARSRDIGVGLGAAFGAHCFLARHFGLAAEYGASTDVFFGTRRIESREPNSRFETATFDSRTFRFASQGVNFGLSVYF